MPNFSNILVISVTNKIVYELKKLSKYKCWNKLAVQDNILLIRQVQTSDSTLTAKQ